MGLLTRFFRGAVDKGGVLALGVGSLLLSRKLNYTPISVSISCGIISFGVFGFGRYLLDSRKKRKEPNSEEKSQGQKRRDIVKLVQEKLDPRRKPNWLSAEEIQKILDNKHKKTEEDNLVEKYFGNFEECLKTDEDLSEDGSEDEMGTSSELDLEMRSENEIQAIGDDDLRIFLDAISKERRKNDDGKNTHLHDEEMKIQTRLMY